MSRVSYLLVTDLNALSSWANEVGSIFHTDIEPYGLYLVGSSLNKPDFRDVDVRHILSNDDFLKLYSVIDVGYFNHAMSLWGQKTTGLPIDYQIQPIDSPDNNGPKNSLDALDGYINSRKRLIMQGGKS